MKYYYLYPFALGTLILLSGTIYTWLKIRREKAAYDKELAELAKEWQYDTDYVDEGDELYTPYYTPYTTTEEES